MLGGLFPTPGIELPDLSAVPAVQSLFAWIGVHVLGISEPIVLKQSGSGDKLFDWVQSFSLLLIAIIATVIWSVVSKREHHTRLYTWFRLFVRFALGTTLISYGMAKAIPMQMPILALARLVEPFGNFSPMGVLWYSVGAAPAYEVITGCAELTAGILLFWPRTATLGALLALMDMTMVFILNMTYDVPVKLFSFHLVVLSIVIIAPNAKRLFDLFVLHRSTTITEEPAFGRVPTTNRRAVVAQLLFAAYVLSVNVYQGVDSWATFGGGAPKSPLFGIWDVTDMSIDGQQRPALLTDMDRFHRLIFQQSAFATVQQMDDTFKRYGAVIDTAKHTLALTASDSTKTKASLTYRRVTPQQLAIDGTMGGHVMHLDARMRPLNSFLLRNRGFHWVQELPFNR